MKLLLLLSLVGLAVGHAIIPKPIEVVNDVLQEQGISQEPQEVETYADERKVDKRSSGWSPWIWPSIGHGHISHGHGWPILSHGWSSHGWPSHGWSGGHGWSGSYGWPSHGWSGGHSWHGWPSIWLSSSSHGWSGYGGSHSKW